MIIMDEIVGQNKIKLDTYIECSIGEFTCECMHTDKYVLVYPSVVYFFTPYVKRKS